MEILLTWFELALAEIGHITYPWRWQLDLYRVGDGGPNNMHSGDISEE